MPLQGLKPVRQLSDQSPEALRSHQALLPGNKAGAMATAVSIGGAQLPQVRHRPMHLSTNLQAA